MVVSTVLLLALYYLVFTPIGLLARLFGYDPMGRRFERQARTYWQPSQPREGVARYFRQS
ncbi:MAG: hypothetical protein JRI68_32810 [Deltaproteobacteria bacterium]|nr:hypothetical protein [Deltaproteobacteria bacterium]